MPIFDEAAAVEAMAKSVARRNFKSWWPNEEVIQRADAANKADGDILREFVAKNEADLTKKTAELIPDMQAALAALKPFMGGADKTTSACAAFVQWALSEGSWAGCDLDGGAIQTKAQALGLLKVVPYDPVEHEDAGDEYGVEPGDDWFTLTDEVKALLPASPDKGGE